MSNNSSLPIIAVGALGLSSISCVISSLTGFLVSGDSNVESNTSTSNTSTDTSNTSTDTSNTSTDTSNTSTEPDYAIPHQIPSGTDDWCLGDDKTVQQDVPGCGRICSSATNVGSKRDGTWGPWADNSTVASTCVGAKLDEIWEVQDDGTRKLADIYMAAFKYEFIVKHLDYIATQPQHNLAAHIHNVKLYDSDGILIKTITNNDIDFHKAPTHAVNSGDYLGAWKSNTYNKGDKLFTITSDKPVHMMKIKYMRPRYAPGWTIKENGIVRFEDRRNHGSNMTPTPVTYTYTLSSFDDIGDLSYSGYYDISEMEDIGLEYGLMAPNNIHDWQYDINTYEGCRLRAGEKGYNAFGFQQTGTKYCWLRQVPGTGQYTVTGVEATGKGGKEDNHVSGCAVKGKKVSNNCQ